PDATSAGAPPRAPARPSPSASRSSSTPRAPSRRCPRLSCSCPPASSPPRSPATSSTSPNRGTCASPRSTAVSATTPRPPRLATLKLFRSATPLGLNNAPFFVGDEAARRADRGFLPAVKRLLDKTNAKRQTLLFSATLDDDVDVLIKRYQNSPKRFDAQPRKK